MILYIYYEYIMKFREILFFHDYARMTKNDINVYSSIYLSLSAEI